MGSGALPALGSYNKSHHNCYRDALITCVVNTCTCLAAGVLVFSIIWGKPLVNKTGIVFVDAASLETISRVHFTLSGPVPKPLHGCWVSSWDFVTD